MSDHHFDPIERTARKRHCCVDCERAIEPGERYTETRGFSDGAAYLNREHHACRALYWELHRQWSLADDEWIDPHEFRLELAASETGEKP
mgnify:CR=1 FL=1